MYLLIDKETLESVLAEAVFQSNNLDFIIEAAEENAENGQDIALIELHDEYRGKKQRSRERVYGFRMGYDFPLSL